MKILVSGAITYDNIMNFPGYFKDHILPDKIQNLNVSFSVKNLKKSFGGTAGNIAYNLALLGEKPMILSTAGNDFGIYKEWLEKRGIDVSRIKIINSEPTAFCYIMTDQSSDNQITAFYPGAMRHPCIEGNINGMADGEQMAIIAPGNTGDMIRLAKIYKQKNIPFIFDPGQQIPTFNSKNLRECVKGAKVFISNDYELSLVMKKTGWSENEILKNAEILATTFGANGSAVKTKNRVYKISPAKPKNTSDPTGAGDAYRAGFIKGMLENWPLDAIGRFAGVVACYTVEKYGTQTHKFTFKSAAKRYEKNFNEKL